MVLGANMVLRQSWIFQNIFAPKNGENRLSLRFFERVYENFYYYFFSQFGLYNASLY